MTKKTEQTGKKQRCASAQPFKYRKKYRIQVTLKNGTRPCADFDSKEEAVAWAADKIANQNSEHDFELGGPTQASLAQALDLYARRFSVRKGGVHQEVTRINHYLESAGMPLLKAYRNTNGGLEVKEVEDKPEVKKRRKNVRKLEEYVQERRAQRPKTYAFKARLANTICSKISPAMMEEFYTTMFNEGLSESTIQKEIAMLKTFFNLTTKFNWVGLKNPCQNIKLGKFTKRFVHLSDTQRADLNRALIDNMNPYIWPLVIVAKETTLRLNSLHAMTWASVSLEDRNFMLPTKGGQMNFSFSEEVKTVLSSMPKGGPNDKVFPMSKDAISSAWDRVRKAAGLPNLQFRDLRHLGATDWVRRGLNVYELRHVLGHCDIKTAQYYVDLVAMDFKDALDRASKNGGVMHIPPEGPKDVKEHMRMKRAERLKANLAKAVVKNGKGTVRAPEVDQGKPGHLNGGNVVALDSIRQRKTA